MVEAMILECGAELLPVSIREADWRMISAPVFACLPIPIHTLRNFFKDLGMMSHDLENTTLTHP